MPPVSSKMLKRQRADEAVDTSVLEEADQDASDKKKRNRYRNTPMQAKDSLENKLTASQLASVAFKVVNDKTMVQHVEDEISRQGRNYKLTSKFWTPLMQMFEVLTNPMEAVPQPEPGPFSERLVDALEKLDNANNRYRGLGLQMLKAELDDGEEMSNFALHCLLSACFSMGSGASQGFVDKVHFTILKYLVRTGQWQRAPDIWNKIKPIYNSVAMRVFQRERQEYGASSSGFMREHTLIIQAMTCAKDLLVVGDSEKDPEEVRAALERIYADDQGLMKVLLVDAQSKIDFRIFRKKVKQEIWAAASHKNWDANIIASCQNICRSLTSSYTKGNGNWSEDPITLETTFLDSVLELEYNNYSMEWKFPMFANLKAFFLAEGALTALPWEIACGFAPETMDEQVELPDVLMQSNNARISLLEMLGGKVVPMHLMKKTCLKNEQRLKDRDATWELEANWISEKSEGACHTTMHTKILSALPMLGCYPTKAEVIDGLQKLNDSLLGSLLSYTAKEELRQVLNMVAGISMGNAIKKPSSQDSCFYKEVAWRMPWFFEFETKVKCEATSALSGPPAPAKRLHGITAIRCSLNKMEEDMNSGKPLLLADIRGLKPFAFVFDKSDQSHIWMRILTEGQVGAVDNTMPVLQGDDAAEQMALVAVAGASSSKGVPSPKLSAAKKKAASKAKKEGKESDPAVEFAPTSRSKVMAFFKVRASSS